MAKGGAREGAGAPKTTGSKNPANVFTIRLPEDLSRILDELGGNQYLKDLATSHLKYVKGTLTQ